MSGFKHHCLPCMVQSDSHCLQRAPQRLLFVPAIKSAPKPPTLGEIKQNYLGEEKQDTPPYQTGNQGKAFEAGFVFPMQNGRRRWQSDCQ